MLVAKVSLAALCCFIARTLRASAAPAAVVPQQTKRTFREEMVLVHKILSVTAFKKATGTDLQASDLPETVVEKDTVINIRKQLMKLKEIIEGNQDIFVKKLVVLEEGQEEGQEEEAEPVYRGLNRYDLLKGILKSMVKKMQTLEPFMKETTAQSQAVIEKTVSANIASKEEIISDLAFDKLNTFFKAFYGEVSPVVELLKLFHKYENSLPTKTALTDTTNPICALFEDGKEMESDALDDIDRENADMQIEIPGLQTVQLPTLGDSERSTIQSDGAGNTGVSAVGVPAGGKLGLPAAAQSDDSVSQGTAKEPAGGVLTPPSAPQGDDSVSQGTGEAPTGGELAHRTAPHVADLAGARSDQESTGVELTSPSAPQSDVSQQEGSAQAERGSEGTPTPTSLRTESGETSPKKPSSAVDSIVTLLFVVSVAFAF